MNFKDLFSSFKPSFDPVPVTEKIRGGLAATAGILLMGLALRFLRQAGYPLIPVSLLGGGGSFAVCSAA